jgi:hypothetical protein
MSMQLKVWRNADPTTNIISPGWVDAKVIRQKLSKQLKIDLEPHETIHLLVDEEAVAAAAAAEEERAAAVVRSTPDVSSSSSTNVAAVDDTTGKPQQQRCTTVIRKLGEYVAIITLRGGYSIPLQFEIIKR